MNWMVFLDSRGSTSYSSFKQLLYIVAIVLIFLGRLEVGSRLLWVLSESLMKKLVLLSVFGVFASSSMWGAACVLSGNANSVASFLVAGAGGNGTGTDGVNYNGGAGCTVNGYNLNGFTLDNYQDFGYGGPGQYNFLNNTSGSPANTANYVVTFGTAPDGAGLSVTLTGAVAQGDGLPAWSITTDNGLGIGSPFFGFELKYNIATATKDVNALKTVTDTQSNLTIVEANPGAVGQFSEFKKFVQGSTSGAVLLNNIVVPQQVGGTASLTSSLGTTGSFLAVTDNLLLQLNSSAGDHSRISVTSLVNIFDPAPEPMTMALMGLGLAGLAMVRRRTNKN